MDTALGLSYNQNGYRRSARLAAKPIISYSFQDPYDTEDILDAGQINNSKDCDYKGSPMKYSVNDEMYGIIPLFREKTKRWNPSEEMLQKIVKNFENWFDTYKDNKKIGSVCNYDNIGCWENIYDENLKKIGIVRRNIRPIIHDYILSHIRMYKEKSMYKPSNKYQNPYLQKLIFIFEFKNVLQRELFKIGVEYNEDVFTKFIKWYKDNEDRNMMYYSYPWSTLIYRKPRSAIVKIYIDKILKV